MIGDDLWKLIQPKKMLDHINIICVVYYSSKDLENCITISQSDVTYSQLEPLDSNKKEWYIAKPEDFTHRKESLKNRILILV